MSSNNPFPADSGLTADSPFFTADGQQIPGQYGGIGCLGPLDVYDGLNGSLKVAWGPAPALNLASWNVYLNGALYTNVACIGPAFGGSATISGLTQTSYNAGAVAATPNNSSRPQNMPPNGVVTPASPVTIVVKGVVNGVEVAASLPATVTPGPTSIMLTTPMRRPFPFPNTGMEGGEGYGG